MTVPFFVPQFAPGMKMAAHLAMDREKPIMGESVFKFEEEFASYIGTKHAVSVSSGTDALQLTLEGLGIQGEVITNPVSFIATANAIVHAGARPVFPDCTWDGMLDVQAMEKKATWSTEAILPVHLYGHPEAMDELLDFASRRSLPIIEDACQAHGTSYKTKKAGSMGIAGCFSFYTTKNMFVGGDGGMVTTDDDDLADNIRSLRDCGRAKGKKHEHDVIGHTSRLNTVQAAVGREALKWLPEWLGERKAIARLYRRLLAPSEHLRLPTEDGAGLSSYHLFVIRSKHRDALREHLTKMEIQTGIHYPIPIPLQKAYRSFNPHGDSAFPKAKNHADEVLSLPIYPGLRYSDVRHVCDEVNSFMEAQK